MRHIIFENSQEYKVAILIKNSALNKYEIQQNYVSQIQTSSIAFSLKYENNKVTAAIAKEYLSNLLPALVSVGVNYLYVADAAYFKALTKVAKTDPHIGYVLPCKIKGFEQLNCVLGANYQQLIFNPGLKDKIDLSIAALNSHINNSYVPIGDSIIHTEQYPEGFTEACKALEQLYQYPKLTCDIEAFSLRFNEAGIGSIAFAWDHHNGIAFEVDCLQTKTPKQAMRYCLRQFFSSYKGELIFHNASYDIKAIVYALWMRHPLDYEGMLRGIDVMCAHTHDTKIIAYLATNSTAGNKLSLKELAQSFAGNYAIEVKDITKVPKPDLLKYNLVDCLSTWFVFNKFYPVMIQDEQEQIYKELFLPSQKVLIQTELVGMPMSDEKIAKAKEVLVNTQQTALATIMRSPAVKQCEMQSKQIKLEKLNAKLKTKQHTIDKFDGEVFNPNSGPQLQTLLHEVLDLPVLDKTDTGQPATGGDVLKMLQNHCKPEDKELLTALVKYSEADKILSTFIPAFENGILKSDGVRYLHGSFNLGGTVSGRLSSSDPNLQNLPSNSVYGKSVKECFVAPPGWLFCGADFSSLEDRISALLTKDTNKLKVYTDGFDGHALRAVFYYSDEIKAIDPNDVSQVNSVADKTSPYYFYRQESKAPTFLLTYGGTYHGLISNCGFTPEKAKAIENSYHILYKESGEYVQRRIKEAANNGYATVAFGLRVRAPLLKQVMWQTDSVPNSAKQESRTLGNAFGQSYGLLNNRATNAFMNKVWESKFRYFILPVAQIHDATYFLIKDDLETLEWANKHLIIEMEWQELPEIHHPDVHLGAALDVFKEGWHKPITLPNNATQDEIKELLK